MSNLSLGDGQLSGLKMTPWLSRLLTVCSASFLAGMMVLTFVDVIGRYAFNAPVDGASEIIANLLGLTIFTAFPLVTQDRAHISVGILESFFVGRARYLIRLLVLMGTMAVIGLVSWLMWDQAETMREAEFLTEFLDLPAAPIVYVLSALTGLAGLIFLRVIYCYLKFGGDPE